MRPCGKCGALDRYKCGHCAPCKREWNREWNAKPENRERNRERERERKLQRKFGIGWRDKEGRIIKQKFRCSICKRQFKEVSDFATDHKRNPDGTDYILPNQKKWIRGFPCSGCNLLLPYWVTPAILRAAARYEEQSEKRLAEYLASLGTDDEDQQ